MQRQCGLNDQRFHRTRALCKHWLWWVCEVLWFYLEGIHVCRGQGHCAWIWKVGIFIVRLSRKGGLFQIQGALCQVRTNHQRFRPTRDILRSGVCVLLLSEWCEVKYLFWWVVQEGIDGFLHIGAVSVLRGMPQVRLGGRHCRPCLVYVM